MGTRASQPEPGASRTVLRLLRESHEDQVLAMLRDHGPVSRTELGRLTGLSRTTLSAIIRHLLTTDAVVEVPDETAARGRGRPPMLVALNPGGGLAVGIDLGHRRVHVVVANVAHEVVVSASQRYAERSPWARRLEIAIELIQGHVQRLQLSLAALDGVGVGVVGPVDPHVEQAGSRKIDRAKLARERLADHFGVPVHVDNNTRLAALAEAIWGGGAGGQNVLYTRLSYGVGGGLVLDGQLFSGADGGAAELGHVSVEPEGHACPCGGRGCLERYVSVGAILEQCHARRLDDVLARLRDGDPQVKAVLQEAGWRIGRVFAAACNVANPDILVVGGELVAAGEELLEPIQAAIHEYAHRQVRHRLQLRVAELGDDAAARGGVAVVLRRSPLLAGYPSMVAEQQSTAGHQGVTDKGVGHV